MQFTDFPRCGTPRLAARKNCAYGKKAPRRAVGKVPYEGAQHTALQQARLLGVAVNRHPSLHSLETGVEDIEVKP